MEINFSSSLNSSNTSLSSNSEISYSSDDDIRIKKVGSERDLEKIIQNAQNSGIKSIIIKDNRSSPLRVGLFDLFGNQDNISLLPDEESVYEIKFI